MSYDSPSPQDEESGALDQKITADGVPTDESLPETEPTDPNATEAEGTDSGGADTDSAAGNNAMGGTE